VADDGFSEGAATARREVRAATVETTKDARGALVASLDAISERIAGGDVMGGMQAVIEFLREKRAELGVVAWREWATVVIDQHKISTQMYQCPLTRRSKEKPRGYPGDAVMLDHIYGLGSAACAPHPTTFAGKLYFHGTNSAACRAVRQRRDILAREIDRAAENAAPRKANILSIACGHLREIELCNSVSADRIGRFVAMDQDQDSLDEIERSYPGLGLEKVRGSVRDIIRKRFEYGDMDFVYAAGLFDYLVDPVAMRLVQHMYGYLRPGGRLLIANFTKDVQDIGYMEAFMDWWLIYRSKEQIGALADCLPEGEGASISSFADDEGSIAYAIVEKPL